MTTVQNNSEKTPFISVTNEKPDLRKKEPPLVSVQVTNLVTYLKSWWKRVVSGEGIEFHFKIKPLTAIAITIIVATFGFGVGRFVFSLEKPFVTYVPPASPSPLPVIIPWREAAFVGKLQLTNSKYYLITANSEAIILDVSSNVDVEQLVGRRIFASGRYNESTRIFQVIQASNMEILPKKAEPVPVISPPPSITPVLPSPSSSGIEPTGASL